MLFFYEAPVDVETSWNYFCRLYNDVFLLLYFPCCNLHIYYLCVQVAERALFLWNNDHIRNLITQNRKVILPIIFPALERNTRSHWNQAVQSLTLNVKKIFVDADPDLCEECLVRFQEDEAKEIEIQERRELTWKRLEDVAVSKAISNEAVLVSRFVPSLGMATTGQRGTVGCWVCHCLVPAGDVRNLWNCRAWSFMFYTKNNSNPCNANGMLVMIMGWYFLTQVWQSLFWAFISLSPLPCKCKCVL